MNGGTPSRAHAPDGNKSNAHCTDGHGESSLLPREKTAAPGQPAEGAPGTLGKGVAGRRRLTPPGRGQSTSGPVSLPSPSSGTPGPIPAHSPVRGEETRRPAQLWGPTFPAGGLPPPRARQGLPPPPSSVMSSVEVQGPCLSGSLWHLQLGISHAILA